VKKSIGGGEKVKNTKKAIPLLTEEGVAAPPRKCREATEAAQTGWSARLQILFDGFQDKFDVVAHVAIFKSNYLHLAFSKYSVRCWSYSSELEPNVVHHLVRPPADTPRSRNRQCTGLRYFVVKIFCRGAFGAEGRSRARLPLRLSCYAGLFDWLSSCEH